MATFQEIVDRVEAELIDLPDRTEQEVPSFVRQAIRKLQFRHDFGVCKTSTSVLTTVTGERFLANVPSDFLRFRKELPHVIDNHGRLIDLGVSSGVEQAERELGSTAGGEFEEEQINGPPRILAISEPTDDDNTREFHIYPLPDGRSLYTTAPAGEYRIRIPYIKLLPSISGGQANWFTTNAEEYLIYLAVSIGFYFNQDTVNGDIWFKRAAGEVQDVLALDKKESISPIGTLNVSFDALGPRSWAGDNAQFRGYF